MCQDGVEQWPWVAIDDTPAFYREDAPVVFTDSQTGFQLSGLSVELSMDSFSLRPEPTCQSTRKKGLLSPW